MQEDIFIYGGNKTKGYKTLYTIAKGYSVCLCFI